LLAQKLIWANSLEMTRGCRMHATKSMAVAIVERVTITNPKNSAMQLQLFNNTVWKTCENTVWVKDIRKLFSAYFNKLS